MGGGEDGIVRVGVAEGLRRGRVGGLVAVGHLGVFAGLLVGHVVHGDLGLRGIILLLLALLGGGLGLLLVVVLTGRIGLLLLVGLALLFLILILGVRVVAQLVAVAQVGDQVAGEAGEGGLVGQHVLDSGQPVARRLLDEPAPQVERVRSTARQVAAGGHLPDPVAGGGGQRDLRLVGDVGVALAPGLDADPRIDVGGGAGHRAGADGLAPRGLHRLVEIARHVALRHVARADACVVVAVA